MPKPTAFFDFRLRNATVRKARAVNVPKPQAFVDFRLQNATNSRIRAFGAPFTCRPYAPAIDFACFWLPQAIGAPFEPFLRGRRGMASRRGGLCPGEKMRSASPSQKPFTRGRARVLRPTDFSRSQVPQGARGRSELRGSP